MTALNGRLPGSSLAPIPGGGRLLSAVAVTWLAIIAEVERLHGWTPRPTGPLDAYRDYEGSYYAQVETFTRRYTRTRMPGRPTKVWNGVTYWLKPGQATAAVPGTSNHGWGCAVDVTGLGGFTGTRYRQFAAVAARHGWTNTEGRSIGEPWHWVDVGTAHLVKNDLYDLSVTLTAPRLTPPAPIAPEDDMPSSRLLRHPTGSVALAGEDGTFVPLATPDEIEALKYAGLIKPGDGPAGTVQLQDGLVWDMLTRVAARKASQGSTDPAKIATGVAATLVPAVVAALAAQAPTAGITQAQVEAATEKALRDVLGGLG